MEPSNPNANKISPFLLVLVMITLVLALAFIYMGLQAFLGASVEDGSLNLALGMALLAISTYLLFQTKKRPLKQGLEIQLVINKLSLLVASLKIPQTRATCD